MIYCTFIFLPKTVKGISNFRPAGSDNFILTSVQLLPLLAFASMIPALVSKTDLSLFAQRATHLAPLPHISGSEPSGLNILILNCAFLEGSITSNPSAPIEILRSQNFLAKAFNLPLFIFSFLLSMSIKSLPEACNL